MVWKGASNVGPSGFTVDMNKFQSMSLSSDQKVVTIGTGLSWRQVFSFLLPYNLTTTGGRSSHVGVGGFLLGGMSFLYRLSIKIHPITGGLSFLSYDQGLGSTNVLAYEIILPDASIARVTQHSNPDLYWALKYGSTNFGIVTRFEMTTFHLGEMWGGANYYPPSYGIALFQALVQFTANLAKDPKGLNAVGFFWNTTAQEYFVWSPNFYRLPTPWPAIFDPFKSFKPVMTTQRITNFVSITDEVQAAFTGGLRIEWFSRTLKADAQILWDIQTKHAQLFAQHHHRANFTSGFMAQPWNAGLIKAGASRNGGNPFGQSEANGDLICMCSTLCLNSNSFLCAVIQTSITWLNAADDGPIKSTFNELSKYIVDTAQERGLLTPFIYMNYAQGIQDIMGSIGQDNLKRMRSIRQTNDPHDYFKKYWKGGYKL